MSIEVRDYGRSSVGDVSEITVGSGSMRAVFIDYGARLVELHVPDRDGVTADVVLGLGSIEGHERGPAYYGATCGRFANRIAGGRFTLDGVEHRLEPNEGRNHLHGGAAGFDSRLWTFDTAPGEDRVRFGLTSAAGDQGYPGELTATVEYLLGDDSLAVVMQATTDAPTVVNLVHHSFWNLAGHDSGPAVDQLVELDADFVTPVDNELIPTGEVRSVADTRFDFRRLRPIATGEGDGYDHNWVLRGEPGRLERAATALDPSSGRRMVVETTEPGVQFYTAAHLPERVIGKNGATYGPSAGYTFETQRFPDTPNRRHFPSARLDPGERYDHRMVITFSAD